MDQKFDQSQNKEKTLDHNYDGIQEYDNPLPNWWLMTFFGTIIFAGIYFIHYTYGGAQTQIQELASDLDSLPKSQDKAWAEADLAAKTQSPEILKNGLAVFTAKCGACHGNEGQGVIGPNLTDRFWIHGRGERKDIIQTVTKGVLEKGMPSWDGILTEDELVAVTGFVFSLRNTKPQNPKAPQGDEIKD